MVKQSFSSVLVLCLLVAKCSAKCPDDCMDYQFDPSRPVQDGWYYLNNKWYRMGVVSDVSYPPKNVNRQEAEDYCQKLGGQLVSITCENTNADVAKLINYSGTKTAWIGLKMCPVTNQYTWPDETGAEYTNWAHGMSQPNTAFSGVQMHVDYSGPPPANSKGGWVTYDVNKPQPVICEKHVGSPVEFECTEPWLQYAGLWFWTSPYSQRVNHAEAVRECHAKGAELASDMYDAVLRLAYKQMVPIAGQEMWVREPCSETRKCRYLTDETGPDLSIETCVCTSQKRFTCVKDPKQSGVTASNVRNRPTQTTASPTGALAPGMAWHCSNEQCVTCNFQNRECSWPYFNTKPYCAANCPPRS